jgi:hypothetical protein
MSHFDQIIRLLSTLRTDTAQNRIEHTSALLERSPIQNKSDRSFIILGLYLIMDLFFHRVLALTISIDNGNS